MEIQTIEITKLRPHPQNPRTHPDSAIDKLVKSLTEFGFTNPILVSADNYVLAGHARLKAAQKAGLKEVPVIQLPLKGSKALAYMIADNRLQDETDWDFPLLKDLFGVLDTGELDLETTGFDLSEIEALLTNVSDGLTDDDEVPEPKESICKTSDLWILGNHRLLCGDATKKEDVAKLMGDEKADMVFTDPPYGVKRDKGFEGFGGFGKPIARRRYEEGNWDNESPSKETFNLIIQLAQNLLIFGANFFSDRLPLGKHWIVWDKLTTMPTFGDCELIWTNSQRLSIKKYTFEYNGLIGKEKERFHPTQKPIGLLVAILTDYSKSNYKVLDLFGGSGSTLIACEKLNRKCYMMEIEPYYCDVIIERWQNFTGNRAVKC